MRYYYTYKITLTEGKLAGKVYYGQHTTTDLNDGYKGSGVIITNYYKSFPNGYIKEILKFYKNHKELDKAEYELIKPHLGKDYCLNLCPGGLRHKKADINSKMANVKFGKLRKKIISMKRYKRELCEFFGCTEEQLSVLYMEWLKNYKKKFS